jgi:hypothetical protein
MKKDIPVSVIIGLFVVIAIIYVIGVRFYFEWRIPGYDTVVHLLGGAWVAILFLSVLKLFRTTSTRFWGGIISGMAASLVIGIVWEMYELNSGVTSLTSLGFAADTTGDIAADLIGGLLGSWYAFCRLNPNYSWKREK